MGEYGVVILVIWESSIAINPKNRLNNSEKHEI